ncbi:gluconate 2-dehydrogenase subunit 3 family protein [Sphingomonas sp. CCH5-D11]|uniref:gluconate 2-dehydrogenase subunit 3 family protein n=1 Tax=Sphingomonas sp. CCH5-D11 TaxID=1768786 RepID=UPI0009EC5D7B|nr:gluconate 2-dehydrogenase subunit 3 family protein [Sphingomonas sp. CCH5-D11]
MAWDSEFRLPAGQFFSPLQMRQVQALFRAIHPRDAERGIPGADDCGAATFLDRLLQFPEDGGIRIHDDLGAWKADYPLWLEKLDAAARERFQAPLDELVEDKVTELLQALEQRQIGSLGPPQAQQQAFDTIWRHCLQGCWSDPRWGGNRDRIMWRWLGYLQEAQSVVLA